MATSGVFAATVPTFGLIPFAELTASAGDMKLMACDVSGAHSMSFSGVFEVSHPFSVSLSALLISLLLILSSHVRAGSPSTCFEAWGASPAKASCNLVSVQVFPGDVCYIDAWCYETTGHTNQQKTYFYLDSVGSLDNRNGILRAGRPAPVPAGETNPFWANKYGTAK